MKELISKLNVFVIVLALSVSLTGLAQTLVDPDAAVVEVVAVHEHDADRHLFRISDTNLDSGWTTFQFTNASPVDLFFLIWQYPEEGFAAAQNPGPVIAAGVVTDNEFCLDAASQSEISPLSEQLTFWVTRDSSHDTSMPTSRTRVAKAVVQSTNSKSTNPMRSEGTASVPATTPPVVR